MSGILYATVWLQQGYPSINHIMMHDAIFYIGGAYLSRTCCQF